jgi:hypothetical protein
MKKLFLSMFTLVLLSFTAVQAQDAPKAENEATPQEVVAQDEKAEIKVEELPKAVQESLKSEDYNGWTVEAVYHVKSKDQYEVKLKNGTESKKVKFNKDGKTE